MQTVGRQDNAIRKFYEDSDGLRSQKGAKILFQGPACNRIAECGSAGGPLMAFLMLPVFFAFKDRAQ